MICTAVRAEHAEVRELPLAIGHGGGDAVGVQAQAAHAEGGARTEAADGKLRVLRVVLAVEAVTPGTPASSSVILAWVRLLFGSANTVLTEAGTSMSATLRRRVALTSTGLSTSGVDSAGGDGIAGGAVGEAGEEQKTNWNPGHAPAILVAHAGRIVPGPAILAGTRRAQALALGTFRGGAGRRINGGDATDAMDLRLHLPRIARVADIAHTAELGLERATDI